MLNVYAIFKRMFGKANFILGVITSTAVVMVMVTTIISAVSRWIKVPVHGIDELNGLLVGMAIYLGIALTQANKANIRVTFLVEKLSVRNASLLDMFILAITAAFFARISYLYGEEAYRAFITGDFIQGVVSWPTWPLALAMFLGVVMLVIQLVIDVLERVREFVTATRSKQLGGEDVRGDLC